MVLSTFGLVVAIAAVAVLPTTKSSAEAMRTGGTGAATALLQRLADSFARYNPDNRIEVVPSLGSSGGIRAVRDGVLAFAVSGRPLTADETAAGLSELPAAKTPFILVASHANANGLRSGDIAALFAADKPVWADGTPIRIVLRPKSESDTTLIGELFPGMRAAIDKARQRMDVPIAATDQDNADMAERLPGSLVAMTYVQLTLEHRNLRPVPIDGVEPTFENFEAGKYRYSKPLYFVVRQKPGPDVDGFLRFLRSEEGERMLREVGVLPLAP